MSGMGKPLLMDKITRDRCLKKASKMDFARVLVEVFAEDDLPNVIEIEYPPLGNMSTHVVRPRTKEEIADKAIKEAIKSNIPVAIVKNVGSDDGFVTVGRQNRPVVS
nr:hypothetical protein [Tanacetum cinerariifolium]